MTIPTGPDAKLALHLKWDCLDPVILMSEETLSS